MTKYNALLKYILFEADETARARLTLLRVSDDDFQALQRPVLWRVRLVLPLRECELSPAELSDIAQHGQAVALNVLAPQPGDQFRGIRRLEQQRCIVEMEQLQRNLFTREAEEPIAAFINQRMFQRRNS